mgnify:CR=1 FL=1
MFQIGRSGVLFSKSSSMYFSILSILFSPSPVCFVPLYYEPVHTNHFTLIIAYIIQFVNIFCKRLQFYYNSIKYFVANSLFILHRKFKVYVSLVADITCFFDKNACLAAVIFHILSLNKTKRDQKHRSKVQTPRNL